jgi:formylglycine-generating enzyme
VWKGGTASPTGDGRWGQADLGGNVQEWVLDSYAANYGVPCTDCAALSGGGLQMNRGGDFQDQDTGLYTSLRRWEPPIYRTYAMGVRCARVP